MDNFIVSARKYRPATFDMVVGQDSITSTLKNAISNNHLAQAYLFCGPRGVGKTTCARIFAKTINCSNPKPNFEACDECESCFSYRSQRSYNIHELDAASNNSVDDIRNLTDQVRIPPQIGKYSVYIIDEVHMLSTSAFNAFLKTLEEPPSHAIFILATTEKHKIIPTILSRCQIFDFNRINVDDIVNRLAWVAGNEGVEAEHEALHVIATKADGAMRDALSIFDQIVSFCGKKINYKDVIDNLNVLDYEYYFRIVEAAAAGDMSSVLIIYNEILEKGFDGFNFMAGLNNHLRDLLVSRDEATIKLLETSVAVKQRYREQAQKVSVPFLYGALDAGSQCLLSFKASKNQRLHVELTLLKMCKLNADFEEIQQKKNNDSLSREAANTPVNNNSSSSPSSGQPAATTKQEPEPAVAPDVKQPAAVLPRDEKKISIKNLLSDTGGEQKKNPGTTSAANEPVYDNNFSGEELVKAWSEFAEKISQESPRIYNSLSIITPEADADRSIKLRLDNMSLKETFDHNFKARLEHHLKVALRNSAISIETVVEATERSDILYTDEQKLNYIASKSPVVKELKKTFNLDFE
jgi:DNA polymerase III subunit gamma/tau